MLRKKVSYVEEISRNCSHKEHGFIIAILKYFCLLVVLAFFSVRFKIKGVKIIFCRNRFLNYISCLSLVKGFREENG